MARARVAQRPGAALLRPLDGARLTPAEHVLALQRTAGNRAVARLAVLARDVTQTRKAQAGDVRAEEVDEHITETISHAPAGFEAWNGVFGWQARWRLTLDMRDDDPRLEVTMRLFSTATRDQKQTWTDAIRDRWDNKYAFAVKRDTPLALPEGGVDEYEELYPIRIRILWVDDAAKAHYTITPHAAGDAVGGRAGRGGTTDMQGWGITNALDVAHEFGHMLGCPEEYFTTNDVDFSRGGAVQGFRDPGGGAMNNPDGPALARNFNLIREEGAVLRGVRRAQTAVVPWP